MKRLFLAAAAAIMIFSASAADAAGQDGIKTPVFNVKPGGAVAFIWDGSAVTFAGVGAYDGDPNAVVLEKIRWIELPVYPPSGGDPLFYTSQLTAETLPVHLGKPRQIFANCGPVYALCPGLVWSITAKRFHPDGSVDFSVEMPVPPPPGERDGLVFEFKNK